MGKKTSRSKFRRVSSRGKKNESSSLLIFRYSISIIGVFLLVSVLYPKLTKTQVKCANSISCKQAPKFQVENDAVGVYNNRPVAVPNIYLAENESASPVLGAKTSQGEKHIYVNLETQTLSAYEGQKLFLQTPISSGLWGKTPKGEFNVWVKFRATRMSGGSGADYYDLPNVPYVMFFSNEEVPASAGFSIHGTYWHNNFGHAMSHGCVNTKTSDAAKLFEWADAANGQNKGTPITIYGNS